MSAIQAGGGEGSLSRRLLREVGRVLATLVLGTLLIAIGVAIIVGLVALLIG